MTDRKKSLLLGIASAIIFGSLLGYYAAGTWRGVLAGAAWTAALITASVIAGYLAQKLDVIQSDWLTVSWKRWCAVITAMMIFLAIFAITLAALQLWFPAGSAAR